MHKLESIFGSSGLCCVVLMRSPGFRCGYVGVPKEHPLYGRDYDEYLNIKKDDLKDHEVSGTFPLVLAALDPDPRIKIQAYFHCHGGITYSDGGEGSEYPLDNGLWWFGFDCDHAGDKRDYKTAKEYFKYDPKELKRIWCNEEADKMYPIDGEIRTYSYVRQECMKLAEELANYKEV